MCNDLRDAAADHVAHPQRRQTYAGDGDDEADDRQPLVPRGVRKLQVLGIVARAVEDFPDDAQDVDTCAVNGLKRIIMSKDLRKLTFSMIEDNYRWMR